VFECWFIVEFWRETRQGDLGCCSLAILDMDMDMDMDEDQSFTDRV
jgi:hypothetical protein